MPPRGPGGGAIDFFYQNFLFLLVRRPCKNLKPYDNPFWAVQALKRIISGPVKQRIPQPRNRKVDDNHRSCPQAQYKLGRRGTNQRPVSSQSQGSNSGQESSGGSQGVSYYDVVSGSYKYSVPVDNRFDVLGN